MYSAAPNPPPAARETAVHASARFGFSALRIRLTSTASSPSGANSIVCGLTSSEIANSTSGETYFSSLASMAHSAISSV